MSISLRTSSVVALASLAVSAGVALPAAAAPRPPGPATVADAGVGKGDSDRDRIADDLESALADSGPGEQVGIIVQGATPDAARRAAPSLEVDHRYRTFTGFSGSVTAGQVQALSRVPGVTRVELNGVVRALDASGNLDYGVTAARTAYTVGDTTLDGTGVGICVIDTGIDPNHQQLSGRVVGWRDWVTASQVPFDDHGHGTHVAGIAAGRPVGSADASYGGVATGATLVAAKVLNSAGSGADADVVAAIEWCAARGDVRVISMSLGSPGSDGSDAGSRASDAAVAAGKVVVAAAGNSGDAPGTISSPGVATNVVTVGAASDPASLAGASDSDTSLYLAGFSSRGPTANPAAPHKPDVVAPGLSVVAARAGTTSSSTTMSGTSMATPFVAGVVALGLEAAPAASPAVVKAALRSTARDAGVPGVDDEWGAGLVDARAFLSALVPGLGAGTAPWPGHALVEGSVTSGGVRSFPISVTAAGQPLGVTLRTTNGAASCLLPVGGSCWFGYEWAPDLDAYLVSPSGTVVAMSRCMLESTNGNCAAPGRFETVGVASAVAGTWQLRVESFSGAGSFQADVFGAVGAAVPPPPSAPTGLTATATSASAVSLTWSDTAQDETGFEVQRCTGGGCTRLRESHDASREQHGATRTAASPRARRTSTACGRCATETSRRGPSRPRRRRRQHRAGSVPTTPTGLTANAATSSAVNLAWSDTSTDETGFAIERCTGVGCSTFAEVATVSADVTAFTDPGRTADTTYAYRVRAFNGFGFSGYTNTASARTQPTALPSAPTSLTATAASATRVVVAWTDTSTNETGFTVQRCTGSRCTNFVSLATVGANAVSYVDETVLASTSYRYRVRADSSVGPSAWSPIATVKTPRR